ncbi:MAG: hypothetical protein ACRECV_00680 [Xanthobacteraceae bacterium]
MTSDRSSVERLRQYLQSLSLEARATLIAELERAMLREEDVVGSELVLAELRRTIRSSAQPIPRIGDAGRRFFMPLEPFLVDGPADHKRIGRLARLSLEPIWEWIGRDLMPAEARALSEDVNRALLSEDRIKVDQLVRALHDRAIQRMKDVLAGLETNEKAHRRLSVEVGTPRAVDDVKTVLGILAVRDQLSEMACRLPEHIRVFEREHVDQAKAIIDAVTGQKPLQSNAAVRKDLMLYGLIMVTTRLAAPWQLIRIATLAAESDDTARIADSPYAVAVTLVLGEIEYMVGELRSEIKAGRPVASLLKGLHDAARGMRTELDLSVDSACSRRLAAIRGAVSNILTAEIETTPGRVRRLLRPRPAKEIVSGSSLDAIDVQDAETRVELVGACRHYSSELAVSEVTQRTYSELAQYLETGAKILVDALRHADNAERPFRRSQVDAAVRFCGTVFGLDYAGLLTKAAEVAVQAAPPERRPLHA